MAGTWSKNQSRKEYTAVTPFFLTDPLADVVNVRDSCANSHKSDLGVKFHTSYDNLKTRSTVIVEQMYLVDLVNR